MLDLAFWQNERDRVMRITRLLLAALFAVLAFSAMAASTASAWHPLFINFSAKELLFSGLGGKAILRSGHGVVECEKTLIDGFALHLSTLAHRILILFEGKCEATAPVKANCANEGSHIMTKLLLGELGLLTGSASGLTVHILLRPQEGNVDAEFNCGPLIGNITVNGQIIGEIPETSAKGVKQYNKLLSELELRFESVGNNSSVQKIQEIFLLGVLLTGIHLTTTDAEGTLEASEEIAPAKPVIVSGDGLIEITTTKE